MKSVGEVMAIGRTFEEALQKAIRMLDIGVDGLGCNDFVFSDIEKELKEPTDKRIFAVAEAIKRGYSIDTIYNLSKIDKWFLYKIKNIIDIASNLSKFNINELSEEMIRYAKRMGFSDRQIAQLTGCKEEDVRVKRKAAGIVPSVKQIDTLAAEYPAQTNYLYMTYNGDGDDISFKEKRQVMVIGGGPYRIGSSVEFDWCCVNAVLTLKELNYKAIMVNCNPETVSTDYDISDKLYFEELTLERVLDICDKEKPIGVIVSVGGQIPNNLALSLAKAGVNILGTAAHSIDQAEDRHKFSNLLDKLGIDQPIWRELTSLEDAERFAETIGYPVLIRPSYVLSGAAMSIALSAAELKEYLMKASKVSAEHPIVISKFITDAKEIEIDAVAKEGEIFCYAISEHIENAGVHSGDATLVLPPQRTYLETMRRIKIITKKIAKALNITGPFNIQFIAKDNNVKVIECNLRASRSFPFVSKVCKVNFIDIAVRLMMGKKVRKVEKSFADLEYVGVKAPQFSFTRLKGSDPVLGVEMTSTGEVACLGDDFNEAFLKSLLSVDFRLPNKTILLSTGDLEKKIEFLESTQKLQEMGFKFYATKGTADFLKNHGIYAEVLHWPLSAEEPNTLTYIANGLIDLVINIPKNIEKEELDNDYLIRTKAVNFNVPLITNLQLAKRFVEALYSAKMSDLKIKKWSEY
jgi:carbamoyl-phosphate synthase large subunit